MATKAQLASDVLQHLQIVGSGETADSDDLTLVENIYDSVFQMLKAENLVSWGSDDDIPADVRVFVRDVVAYYAAPSFGKVGDYMTVQLGKKVISKVIATPFQQQTIGTDYF